MDQLEYFKLKDATIPFGIPNDFGGLTSMKYLSFENNGLNTVPDSICDLTKLQVLDIQMEHEIESLPMCISNLMELKQLIMDNCLFLQGVPLSVFKLSNLVTLSLFHGSITSQSLIQYNNDSIPDDVDQNNTDATRQWLTDTFVIAPNIKEFHLSLNPICKDTSVFGVELREFIDASCDYPCHLTDHIENEFCPPRLLGDGKCDSICDLGDCVQLCFASQLTGCTRELYVNDVCDEECDNAYCVEYEDSNFQTKVIDFDNDTGPYWSHDNGNCELYGLDEYEFSLQTEGQVTDLKCEESNSSYVSREFRHTYYHHAKCEPSWLGDSNCDDICRTDACNQDGGDCELGSACLSNHCKYIYEAWLLFVGHWIYNVNISYFCNSIYPVVKVVLDSDSLSDLSCENDTHVYDFNQDRFVNFREFVFLAYWFSGGEADRGKQLNCSECIGMENYNVNNNDLLTTPGPIITCEN